MVKVYLRPWSLLKPNRVYDVTIQFSFSGNHADLYFVCTLIWIILYLNFADTVSPTAYITTSTPFTNALNVSINISFSEPCTGPTGGGSFVCSSVNDCNVSRRLTNTLNWFYILYSILALLYFFKIVVFRLICSQPFYLLKNGFGWLEKDKVEFPLV